MANIVGMQKKSETTELKIELNDSEMKNLDLNNPLIVLSEEKLNFKAMTHQVPSKSGKSIYLLLPSGLKKVSNSLPLKEKQEFKCGVIETAEGGYVVYQYKN